LRRLDPDNFFYSGFGNGCLYQIIDVPSFDRYLTSEVQCGQRVALIGICDRQCGQSLVVGAAGASSCFFSVKRLTCFINKKMAKATIKKSMTVFRKMQYFRVAAPALP
jgi:hypothetical protein